jgi:hypothetical protein
MQARGVDAQQTFMSVTSRVAMNARLRDRRSSLAITSFAFCLLRAASASSMTCLREQ